jgi:hypothetical protein
VSPAWSLAVAVPAACLGPAPSYAGDVVPILERRCYGCLASGGTAAEDHDWSRFATLHAQKDAVTAQVSSCGMPPAGAPTLDPAEAQVLIRWTVCGAPKN